MNIIEQLMSAPTKKVNKLPTVTKNIILPFQELAWSDFERFCFQLGCKEMDCLETSYIYGRNGQKQDGIDIYFHKQDQKILWQIKRYEEFKATDVSKAVDTFLDGKWADKTSFFTLCVSNYLDDTSVVDEIDRQTEILKSKNITLAVLNSEKLTILSKSYPELVETFFGNAWHDELFVPQSEASQSYKNSQWFTNTGIKLSPDKIYEHGNFKLKVNTDSFDIEETLPDGSDTYVTLNTKNGAVQIHKPPYPLNEYTINVNPNMFIRAEQGETVINQNRYSVLKLHLKWGKSAVFFFNESGLVDMTIDCKTFINHSNKTINILDISEDAIKL